MRVYFAATFTAVWSTRNSRKSGLPKFSLSNVSISWRRGDARVSVNQARRQEPTFSWFSKSQRETEAAFFANGAITRES